MDVINLRNIAANICDIFEDLLDKHDITIPSDDRTGDESEARLYGQEYSDVEDAITEALSGLVAVVKDNLTIYVNTETY